MMTSGKLLEILNDPAKARKLKMEIAITVDAMEPFVKATYKLEGDGSLSVVAYEQLNILYASVSTQHYPNVVAVARAIAGGNPTHKQKLVAYAKVCVEPAYNYFCSKFDDDLKPVLVAFKAARCFSPSKFYDLEPTVADIDCLRAFPFLDSQSIIYCLKAELPAYLAHAEDVSTEINPVAWWKRHATNFPNGLKHSDAYFLSNHLLLQQKEYFEFCMALQLNNSNLWRTMLNSQLCYNTTVVQFTEMVQFM